MLKDIIKDNIRQIYEILALIVVFMVPLIFDLSSYFSDYLSATTKVPIELIHKLILKFGNITISVGLFFVMLIFIKKYNKEFLMNQKNVYHDYSYLWYCFCANVLGIKKCNLVLIPIYMQFKLVINRVFEEYPLDEKEFPDDTENHEIQIQKINWTSECETVNIILEDTYPISIQQIPKTMRKLPTIIISRNNGEDLSRHFNQRYIDSVITEIRKLKNDAVVNVFATTNPLHSYHIANRAFKLANRGNIAKLYVFQQKRNGKRGFNTKEHRIF